MMATHDPRLVEIAGALAVRHGRAKGSYEFQMLYGVRPDEQRRLAERGRADARLRAVRRRVVRLPGPPAWPRSRRTCMLFLRSLVSKG